MKDVIISTLPDIKGYEIIGYQGVCSASSAADSEMHLTMAMDAAVSKLKEIAADAGADAVIGLHWNVHGGLIRGGQGILAVASGTAVRLKSVRSSASVLPVVNLYTDLKLRPCKLTVTPSLEHADLCHLTLLYRNYLPNELKLLMAELKLYDVFGNLQYDNTIYFKKPAFKNSKQAFEMVEGSMVISRDFCLTAMDHVELYIQAAADQEEIFTPPERKTLDTVVSVQKLLQLKEFGEDVFALADKKPQGWVCPCGFENGETDSCRICDRNREDCFDIEHKKEKDERENLLVRLLNTMNPAEAKELVEQKRKLLNFGAANYLLEEYEKMQVSWRMYGVKPTQEKVAELVKHARNLL